MLGESKQVAIVVPLSNRSELTREESISMAHLLHFLGNYDKYLVAPEGLKVNFPGFEVKRFDKKFFGSARAHSRLLLSPLFYESFRDYRFILIYHLDALVFSDQLQQWCEKDFDFIGPPWIPHPDTPYAGKPAFEGKVGNGGFSLRKVESFLKVIYSPVQAWDPEEFRSQSYAMKPWLVRLRNFPKKIIKEMGFFNSARREMSRYGHAEEHFWANRANHFYPDFRIAPLEEALRFAFECVPRYCYERNNFKLPFGCHAWEHYDREFWQPFLLDETVVKLGR